ncbi:MAG: SurA N-terminal domain-containing protein [Elusimicrobia bacterium]|nr:SurA N-terminal domain-containing protein [Elusimicrobiota bacterium]
MNAFLRRHQVSVLIATAAIFIGGMFVGFGGYWFTSRDMEGVVAKVGDVKIPYDKLMTRVNLYSDQLAQHGTVLDDAKMNELEREMLNNMMVDEMLAMKADELGIVVTDAELSRDIRATPAFQRGGAFDQALYFQAVRETFNESPQQYERDRRKSLKTQELKSLFYRLSKVTPDELRDAYAAAHGGSMKGFAKEGPVFAQKLQQQKALELVNYCLRQMQSRVQVVNNLSRFEHGA